MDFWLILFLVAQSNGFFWRTEVKNETQTQNVDQLTTINKLVKNVELEASSLIAEDSNNLTNQSSHNETALSKDAEGNSTLLESMSSNFTKVNCSLEKVYGPVEIVNATRLVELLVLTPTSHNGTRSNKEDKSVPAACVLVMFYARWCIFSSQAAPHFNALPRFYPNLKVVAIDAMKYQNFNTQYGIVGVPTLMLVHNAKPVAKFNGTVYTLENFSKFISQLTNLQSNESLFVTSADFNGPVSSVPTNETDYCLVLSLIFIIICVLYFTSQSRWWRQFVELIQNTWRESNAQHEHTE